MDLIHITHLHNLLFWFGSANIYNFFCHAFKFRLGTINASILEWPPKPLHNTSEILTIEEAINVEGGMLNVVWMCYWKKAAAGSRSENLSALSDKPLTLSCFQHVTVAQTENMFWTLRTADYQTAKKMISLFSVR